MKVVWEQNSIHAIAFIMLYNGYIVVIITWNTWIMKTSFKNYVYLSVMYALTSGIQYRFPFFFWIGKQMFTTSACPFCLVHYVFGL